MGCAVIYLNKCCRELCRKRLLNVKYKHQYKAIKDLAHTQGIDMPSVVEVEKHYYYQQEWTELAVHPQLGTLPPPPAPKKLDSSIESSTTLESSETLSTMVQAHPVPSLKFSILYDIQRQCLTVHLQEASSIPPILGPIGSLPPSTFVVLYLFPNKGETFESSVVESNANPAFNEVFVFRGLSLNSVRKKTLVFRVYLRGVDQKNEIIGVATLHLKEADVYGLTMVLLVKETIKKQYEPLYSRGELLISLLYQPNKGLLGGVILKACNIQKQSTAVSEASAGIDCFVKVTVNVWETESGSFRTRTKRKTLSPIFNEAFQFNVSHLQQSVASIVSINVCLMEVTNANGNTSPSSPGVSDQPEQQELEMRRLYMYDQQSISYIAESGRFRPGTHKTTIGQSLQSTHMHITGMGGDGPGTTSTTGNADLGSTAEASPLAPPSHVQAGLQGSVMGGAKAGAGVVPVGMATTNMMGQCEIGEGVSDIVGRSHWSEVMAAPGMSISRWHMLHL